MLRFFSEVRPQGALAGQPGTDRCSNKDFETYPKQCAQNTIIDTLFGVFFVFKKVPLFTAAMDFFSSLRLKIPCYCSAMATFLYFTLNHRVYIRLVPKTYHFRWKMPFFLTLNDDSTAHCPAWKKKNPFSSFFFFFFFFHFFFYFCSSISTSLTSKHSRGSATVGA